MTSSGLSPSSYTISATNSSCPAPPTNPVPHITGPYLRRSERVHDHDLDRVRDQRPSAYTYAWTWNGASVGSGTSYSRTTCPGVAYSDTFNTLGLTVTDSDSHTGSTTLSVEVEKFGSGGTGCFVGCHGAR